MARWRIRHKLLLGLGLAAVLMALLLGGTLRGLWSYYVTTNRIKARTAELASAERINRAVAVLVSDENLPTLARRTDFDADPNVREARAALAAYASGLEPDLDHPADARPDDYAPGLVALMRDGIADLGRAMAEFRKKGTASGPGGDIDRDRDRKEFKPEPAPTSPARLALPAYALPRHADDLRDRIKRDLDERLTDTRRHYQWALWIVVPSSVVGVLLLIGLMWFFYSWIIAPVRAVEKGVQRVAAGDLAHRLALGSGDEMEDLARAFNGMLDRLEGLLKNLHQQVNDRSRQLVRSERLASVGFLAAGVAHEINNPLASIAFCSEALEARLGELRSLGRGQRGDEVDIFRKYLKMIQDEAFRCKSITGRLLEFSRSGEPKREMTDLRGLVQSVLDVTGHLPAHRAKRIVFEVPRERVGPIAACVNAEEIKSVILNLVVNALESMEDGGRLVIRLSQRAGQAELRFTDTGCGMTPEVLENIFEPFFTRSRTGKGTGLGLTISHLVVAQHGGEIEAGSDGPGRGSTFTVRLPVQPANEAAPALGRAA
ncbi:MAG: HAMP domain-containing histidine kinase [Gemmataceae bacterium]|nr:HAMP domain-containing histidine kinase [Gemmataceae bacterium]